MADENVDASGAEKSLPTSGDSPKIPDVIRFDYIKGNHFRIVHADGLIGGVTPQLGIELNFWSERQAIPQQVVHKVEKDGTLGAEIVEQRTVRNAFIREVEVGVVMSPSVAKLMIKWLQDRIAQIEEIKDD